MTEVDRKAMVEDSKTEPMSQPARRPYLLAGGCLAALVVVNWFRLVILALTSFYRPEIFEVMDIYVIQGLLIFAVGILFMIWLSRADLGQPRQEASHAHGA